MKKLSILLVFLFSFSFGCVPTVKVEAPDKPIVINMNIKIEHEIRVKIDKELDDLIKGEEGLFSQ